MTTQTVIPLSEEEAVAMAEAILSEPKPAGERLQEAARLYKTYSFPTPAELREYGRHHKC